MVDLTEISAIVAAAGVLVGVVYYILDMRNQTRIRRTDLIMRLYSNYGTSEFRDALIEVYNLEFNDYESFVEKYGPWMSKGAAQTAVFVVAWYFEGIGALLDKNLVDINLVCNLLGGPIKLYWKKIEPLVLGLRKDLAKGFMIHFESLYNEAIKREQKASHE